MKALHYVAAAAAAVLVAAPASASVFDYGVYASGNATVSGGSLGKVAAGVLVNANGAGATNVKTSALASAALTAQAAQFSANLGLRAAAGTFADVFKAGLATGPLAGIATFNLTAEQFNDLYVLNLASLGSGAVFNISGDKIDSSLKLGTGTVLPQNLIFNFKDATSVTLNGSVLGGTILAPKAAVTLNGGTVAGTVVAASVRADGLTVGGTGFAAIDINADAPLGGAVPEPATWGTMILGMGLAGAAMRRRRVRVAYAA